MNNHIIINLPVKDVDASKNFFIEIGLELNKALTDENAVCFDVNQMTTIALLPNLHFMEATQGEIADTSTVHEMLLSVGKDSEETVDSIINLAIKNGAVELHEPIRTSDVYGRSFSDLDGHQWNIFYKF